MIEITPQLRKRKLKLQNKTNEKSKAFIQVSMFKYPVETPPLVFLSTDNDDMVA